jgi:hypothetical protein
VERDSKLSPCNPCSLADAATCCTRIGASVATRMLASLYNIPSPHYTLDCIVERFRTQLRYFKISSSPSKHIAPVYPQSAILPRYIRRPSPHSHRSAPPRPLTAVYVLILGHRSLSLAVGFTASPRSSLLDILCTKLLSSWSIRVPRH